MTNKEIITDYVTRAWNKRDTSAVLDYIQDPCWRHDAGEPTKPFMQFSNADQMQRMEEGYAVGDFDFEILHLLESGEFVTMVWNLTLTPSSNALRQRLVDSGGQLDEDGNLLNKGIEVFRLKDGKIVETWVAQSHALTGHWGETMS